MRESNFAFPAQNKACVCISSQLYDRRALDTTAPLPLFNSLTHLTYLTSTSPRIREIMTMDGGLERLVRILHQFCLSPPPPELPAHIYGLLSPASHPPKPAPVLLPSSWDKHAAYRFSLAFQCVVNIGVRGSEPIRSRVVQAGTLEVVGCILEAWLAARGFAVSGGVGGGSGASIASSRGVGVIGGEREQRQTRRLLLLQGQVQGHQQSRGGRERQREEAAALTNALQRQITMDHTQPRQQQPPQHPRRRQQHQQDEHDQMNVSPVSRPATLRTSSTSSTQANTSRSASEPEPDTDTDTSTATTPGSETPTRTGSEGEDDLPLQHRRREGRDRRGTIIARPANASGSRVRAPIQIDTQATIRGESANAGGIRIALSPSNANTGTPFIPPMSYRSRSHASSSAQDSAAFSAETDSGDADGDGDIEMRGSPVPGSSSSRTDIVPFPSTSGHARINSHRLTTPSGSDSDDPRHIHSSTDTNAPPGPSQTHAHIVVQSPTGEEGLDVEGGPAVAIGVDTLAAASLVDGIQGTDMNMNDDFAMGAPPGAPGAMTMGEFAGFGGMDGEDEDEVGEDGDGMGIVFDDEMDAIGEEEAADRRGLAQQVDATPRAGFISLPPSATPPTHSQSHSSPSPRPAHPSPSAQHSYPTAQLPPPVPAAAAPIRSTSSHHTHSSKHDSVSGPYRDEDVLLALQLLAYLSKYPHVRQAFYKTRISFHPDSVNLAMGGAGGGRWSAAGQGRGKDRDTSHGKSKAGTGRVKEKEKEKEKDTSSSNSFFRTLTSRGKSSSSHLFSPATSTTSTTAQPSHSIPSSSSLPQRQTNVFSLVERFTFKPSSAESELSNSPPRLPQEIQYWAGVIMRNACRKDESRGGIRQCANMLCGRWESYPREFAKCRRCRKAKYCGKECQSTAWSEGHRFWCSAKDADDEATGDVNAGIGGTGEQQQSTTRREDWERRHARQQHQDGVGGGVHIATEEPDPVDANVRAVYPTARRRERERGREREERR